MQLPLKHTQLSGQGGTEYEHETTAPTDIDLHTIFKLEW